MEEKIKKIISNIPSLPGIYLMKNSKGVPIYIGKAKSLKRRVSSYFQESATLPPRTASMVGNTSDIDFVSTQSEIEALILESNFVKKYKPKYNVLLKDDKHYPYLCVTTHEEFPRLEIVRRVKKNNGIHFGPYTAVKDLRQTLRCIYRIFPIRQCKHALNESQKRRPCLNWQMGHCLGPCSGSVSQKKYQKIIEEVILFLKGRNNVLVELLKKEMAGASKKLDFERAARVRDQISGIKKVVDRQSVFSPNFVDMDILGSYMERRSARIQILSVRGGKMMSQRSYSLHYTKRPDGEEIMSSFIKQYYESTVFIPSEIITEEEIPDKDLIERWLGEKKRKKVSLIRPARGKKRLLVGMAEENAKLSFLKSVGQQEKTKSILSDIQKMFLLKNFPGQIDAFDISNTFGASAVGAMVVYVDGKPEKTRYKRFSIKTVEGINDYAMMEEVLMRHYGKVRKEGEYLPDLILIDGGKGHLSCAVRAMKKLDLGHLEIISIAKGKKRKGLEADEIFLPGSSNPVFIPQNHGVKKFLQCVRDEVHRFVISAHRKARQKKAKHSVLDEIKGIGPKKRLALMKHFKGLEAMKKADLKTLKSVPGMTDNLAKAVKKSLEKTK